VGLKKAFRKKKKSPDWLFNSEKSKRNNHFIPKELKFSTKLILSDILCVSPL